MREMTASRRAEIDDLLYDEAATAGELRAALGEMASENDRLRVRNAKQSVLLKRAHDDARTALACTGGER
ncbi:hypothetical protein AB0B15_14045 [Streptomyces sp. NPDC045456]|uniref:hypothetical protein n=1 Tax=Streptomyces sp. NPDC045456 TaxID=3155254 RepID=UPI0033F2792B